ncbi:CaiB/BaiF CoA transferase family protein [Acrocarpospora catenulata]|uniref:CaiB/BaiF CoA transferase family protein n=1 Tax=Acrocarpospora catenulata TaxID=2836182 RepID=UPI001BD99FCD|nr:CoA transferase [Acrocarpospora catenulata]
MLDGLRVVEFATNIAGPYCGKLLHDAGADVVKAEGASGDPLRRWTHVDVDITGDSALFRFINAGKRSVLGSFPDAAVGDLVATADLVIESGELDDAAIREIRSKHPRVHVLSITPFGRTGPWRDRPVNEFTLQAMAGSTGSRGLPGRPPVFAGGRLGEFIAGCFAGVVAAALARQEEGEHVDLSMLEAMCSTMSMQMPLTASLDGRHPGPERRFTWLPSNHPTVDGHIGLCTATGQMFADFAVLLGRPELADDPSIRTPERFAELSAIIDEWTSARTAAEIEELAAAFRLPVAPLGSPETLTKVGHFADRGVYVDNADGGFRQPRIPYLVDGRNPPLRNLASPALGAHSRDPRWCHAPRARRQSICERPLPLSGVRIVDLTAFWAGPFMTQVLSVLGAEIVKVESVQRPDGMRFATPRGRTPTDEPWWEWGGLFQASNWNKQAVTLNLADPRGRSVFLDLAAGFDLVVENFSPRVMDGFGLTAEVLKERNPRLSLIRMPAFGLEGPWRDRVGLAQTIEQAAGPAWMTGYSDGPPMILKGPCDPIAGLHAAFAAIVALEHVDRTGGGVCVEVPMVETALNVSAALVVEFDAYGQPPRRRGNRGPRTLLQGVFACGADGSDEWLAVSAESRDQLDGIGKVLKLAGLTVPVDDAAADRLEAAIARACQGRDVRELERALIQAGVPAARVCEPSRVDEHEQHAARSYIERFVHPLAGARATLGMPFRFARRWREPWLRSAPPLLGEHNEQVLGAVVHDGLADLERAGVVGRNPVGR